MKEKIVLLSVLKYTDKDSGVIKSRLGFIFASPDKKQDSKNFKGFAELAQFYDDDRAFTLIKNDMLGDCVDATFKVVSNPSNPLKTKSIIEKIEYKGNVINLL